MDISGTGHQHLVELIKQRSTALVPIPAGLTSDVELLGEQHIRAVIFDVYGTLFISGSGDISLAAEMSNGQALAAALAIAEITGDLQLAGEAGVRYFSQTVRDIHQQMREQGTEYPEIDVLEVWQAVLEELAEQGLVSRPWSKQQVAVTAVDYECRVNPVWPMPGAEALLKALAAAGMHLGIVSNSQFYTPLMFEAFFGQNLSALGFSSSLCSWSYCLRVGKPATSLFVPVANALVHDFEITPNDTLYVGNDMLNDVSPAAHFGWRTALFAGDQRSLRQRSDDVRCTGVTPDLVVNTMAELLRLV